MEPIARTLEPSSWRNARIPLGIFLFGALFGVLGTLAFVRVREPVKVIRETTQVERTEVRVPAPPMMYFDDHTYSGAVIVPRWFHHHDHHDHDDKVTVFVR